MSHTFSITSQLSNLVLACDVTNINTNLCPENHKEAMLPACAVPLVTSQNEVNKLNEHLGAYIFSK